MIAEHEITRQEWHERLAAMPTQELGIDAASLIAQERAARDKDLPALLRSELGAGAYTVTDARRTVMPAATADCRT